MLKATRFTNHFHKFPPQTADLRQDCLRGFILGADIWPTV